MHSHGPRRIHCESCGHFGRASITETLEVRESMYDRPATREAFEIDTCEECGSDKVLVRPACVVCDLRPIEVTGTDFCLGCYAQEEAHQDSLVAKFNARNVAKVAA